MAESIKEIADRLFGANAAPIEPFPSREISLEEMLRYRTGSKEKLSKRKQSRGKESTGDTGYPCPKCGISKWDEFPDGRKYCLECGAVMEIDGTVTGGAINKNLKNKEDKTMISGELRCEKCGKAHPFFDTEERLMEFIKQPHMNCGGRISVRLDQEKSKSNESKSVTEASNRNIKPISVPEKSDRCDNPKRDIFICNNCRDFNYCSQKNIDAIICLLISIDLKLKKIQGK